MSPTGLLPELRRVASLAGPVTVAYALQEGADALIPLWAAGRYRAEGTDEVAERLGALGLGNAALVCLALVVKSGWTGGQDALVSQAYGRKDFAVARTHLHQCQLWMTGLALVCGLLLSRTEGLLLAMGAADAATAAMAGRYMLAYLPGLWFEFQYDTLKKFLMNQELPRAGLVVLCLTVPVQAAAIHLLLAHTEVDFMEVIGMAVALKSFLSFSLLGAYMSWCQPRPSCAGWWWPFHGGAVSFRGLRDYARLGLPSTGMTCCDWWAWEMLTVMAGALGDSEELAAHVAAATASNWLFLVVRGAPKAATVLVGSAAGRGDVASCRSAARACAMCCAALSGALALSIWCMRHSLVDWLLPGAEQTQLVLESLIPLVVSQLVLDSTNSLLDGIMAGLGWQGLASIGMLVACWIVQLPLAWQLSFGFGLGTWGLRCAAVTAALLQVVYNLVLLRIGLGGSAPAVAAVALDNGEPQLPVAEYAAVAARPAVEGVRRREHAAADA